MLESPEPPTHEEQALYTVRRLEIKPGDVVVFKTPANLSRIAFAELAEHWEIFAKAYYSYPVPCLILEAGMDIAIVSEAEAANLGTPQPGGAP